MKIKIDGLSLLIAMGVSFVVLGISVAVLNSISKNLEQSTAIERSNQIFFAAESGIEAAFFHHNSRGQGVHFTGSDSSLQLTHPVIGGTVTWGIDGRAKPITGLIRAFQSIQIPLFWDNATLPTDDPPLDVDGNFDPTHANAGAMIDPFTLTFANDATIPDTFDFGDAQNEVLIDWSVGRQHSTNGFETLTPTIGSGAICDASSTFICEDEFLGTTQFTLDSSDITLEGEILPGRVATTIDAFTFPSAAVSRFKVNAKPLLPFENAAGTQKIPGIPFTLDNTGTTTMPKSTYTVTSNVLVQDFVRTINVDVAEKTAIGAFDYVIFD